MAGTAALIKKKNLCSCFDQLGIRFDQGKNSLKLFWSIGDQI
jgi:hypothetical protein